MKTRKSSDAVRDMMLARKSGIPPAQARSFIKADLAEDRGMAAPAAPKKKRGRPQGATRSRAY